jgi:putative SOS response-associated peptidase YedK
MCYDTKSGLKLSLKYAKHRGDDPAEIAELERLIKLFTFSFEKHYHVSGFAHPQLMVFTNEKPFVPQGYVWGLIPHWIKDKPSANITANQTLNARAETIFEKPAFRQSARNKRCLIYVDAFYEHHHAFGKTFPYHVSMKDGSPLSLAGLWDEWVNKETGEIVSTCSIITTTANKTMSRIHNHPKLEGPRMPVILPKDKQNEWLSEFETDEDIKRLTDLLVPFDDELLEAYTVRRLKGKEATGDNENAEKEYVYAELNEAGRLF